MVHEILIVEDERNIALSLEFLMKQAGHSVRSVGDGQDALDAVADTAGSVSSSVEGGPALIEDLRAVAPEDLMARYGSMGRRLHDLAFARDSRSVNPREAAKSVSAETTFSEDIVDLDLLDGHLWRLSEKVSARCKAKGYAGRTVTLKLKTKDFRLVTRSHSLPAPTQLADALYRAGRDMLEKTGEGRAFRLIGIGVSGLCDAVETGDGSVDLFDPQAPMRARAERAMDAVRARYGADAVEKGRGLSGRESRDG